MATPAQQQLLQSLDHVSFSNQVSGEPLDLRVSFGPAAETGRRGSYRVGGSSPRVDNIDDLTKVVNATTADIAIKNNIAPMPITVNVQSANMTKEKEDMHTHLTSANSIAHLYTGILLVNQVIKDGYGELWNINESDEAIVALANTANAAYRVMLGPLVGLYNIKATTASTYNKTMKRSQIHGKFLEEFLGSYGLLPTQLDVLDGVLTDYVKAVGKIPVTPEEQSTVDQVFRINQVTKNNITGDDRYPVWVLQPQTRLVHLKININTWAHAVQRKVRKSKEAGLSGKDEAVNVAMDITVVDAVLNVEEFLRHRDRFEDIMQTLTGHDLFTFGEAISAKNVTSRL